MRHPLWLRLLHWLNFPLLALMAWSGLWIYWANDVYPGFFPDWFYRLFNLDHRLAEGMAIHFTLGWFFLGNGLLYVGLLIGRRTWSRLVPTGEELARIPATVRDDLAGRLAHGQGAYNPAQKAAYAGALGLAALEVLSGFAIYKPVQLAWLRACFGGYAGARLVHFLGLVGLALFTLVHLVQVARAGFANFLAMITGGPDARPNARPDAR